MTDPHMVHCRFHVRRPSPEPGKFRYTSVFCGRADDSVVHRTPYPPSVGDVLGVVDEDNQFLVVRVIARDWSYPVYGSHDWPTGTPSPRKGPSLTLIVEECSGLFHDEYADPAEDEDTTDDE